MNIIIAGGRGFLGQALSGRLAADGHRVLILTRHPTSAGQPWNGARSEHSWTPDGTAGNWASVIEGADAVVNLAGESIAEGRWTDARKQVILESRVRATRSLELAIAQAHRRPAVLVSASAQGYYGDRADDELTEDAEPGNDFLAEVCWEWETEARKAEALTASSCCERASSSRRAGCAAGHDPARSSCSSEGRSDRAGSSCRGSTWTTGSASQRRPSRTSASRDRETWGRRGRCGTPSSRPCSDRR